MGLKWHKFLIYFGLWVSGILNAIVGFFILSDIVDCSAITTVCKELLGFAFIEVAAFAIVTWSYLADKKTNGPQMLIILCAEVACVNALYPFLVHSVSSLTVFNSIIMFNLVGSLSTVFFNLVYYGKRADLFVN